MMQEISFPHLGLSFQIDRVAFGVLGMPIYWYGILIATGLCLAVAYGLREAKRVGISVDDVLNMLIIAVPVSVICARLYYVIFSWEDYSGDLWSILDIRNGGIAIYGAVIGAALVVLCYCKKKKISVGLALDVLSIGLLIGQCIGRWGNFVNGEAFGGPCSLPWAMTIVKNGIMVAQEVHPTFLYESLWNGLGIVLLWCYRKKTRFPGELFCAYLAYYGLGRLWIEGLRADSLYLGPIRVSQLLALFTLIAGSVLIVFGRKKAKANKQG